MWKILCRLGIHNWENWENLAEGIQTFWNGAKQPYVRQGRTCKHCGRLQMRITSIKD